MQNGQIVITESMLSSVIENLTGVIILEDRDRRGILSNKMTEQMTRLSESKIHGKRGGEVLGYVDSNRSPGGCGFEPSVPSAALNK